MLHKLLTLFTLVVCLTACDFNKSSNNNGASDSTSEVPSESGNSNEAYNSYTNQNGYVVVAEEAPAEEEPEVYIDWDRINSEYTEEVTVTENTYYTGNSNTGNESRYRNYKPSSNDCEGVVVYEGRNDYYIIETQQGYSVLETYGGYLWEGDYVKGELNSYNWHYILNTSRNEEVNAYIEDYMLSSQRALEWLGRHNKLKSRDQEIYDREND